MRLRWVAVAGAILLLGAPNAMAGAAGNWSGTDLAFGTHTVSTTSGSQTVTITNADALPHTISGLSIDGANPGAFSLSNDQCTGQPIAPLVGTCTVDVTFSPSSVGADTAAIEVTDETGTTTGGVSDLSGTGTSPMSLPGSVSFGSQNLGTTSSNSVTLNNTGNATFNVTGVTLGGTNPGSFSITTNGCGGAVTGGGQCTVNLQFQPLTVGGNTATLTFSDDVPGDSSQSVTLTGTGTSPVVSVSRPTLSFSPVTIGKLGPIQTVMLSNTGTGPLSVGGVNIAGVNPGSFAIASNTCGSTLAAGASCTVGVQFTPKLAQLLTGALKFHTTPKAQVALTGNGNPPPAVQNVRAAAGCSATLLTWKPNSSVAGFLSTVIVRRHRRAPRSPSDGLVLRPEDRRPAARRRPAPSLDVPLCALRPLPLPRRRPGRLLEAEQERADDAADLHADEQPADLDADTAGIVDPLQQRPRLQPPGVAGRQEDLQPADEAGALQDPRRRTRSSPARRTR